jgi:hypothetical protein
MDELLHQLRDISSRYGLNIFYLDFTEVTLLSRFGLSVDIFIELYVNLKKQKINLALIVSGNRIYGIDKEGGFYHEHPFKNPEGHMELLPFVDTVKATKIDLTGIFSNHRHNCSSLNPLPAEICYTSVHV